LDAVVLARAVPGRPVLVTWSRRDELTCAPFGSAMTADVEAVLDDEGRIRSWTYDVWSQGHVARPGYAGTPGLLATYELGSTRAPAADPPQPDGGTTRNAVPPYEVGSRRITGHRLTSSPVRTSSLRSLGAYLNVFAMESFMDELALVAARDPLDFRLTHLSDPRAREVLSRAASVARWGTPTDENAGRGIGFARYKNTGAYCAVVAEVEAVHDIRVRSLTIAVDVGLAVNPDGVRNQIEGGATQSTSWTLKERARPGSGVDWETYPILRFSEAPEIHVELVPSTAPSVGAGEAAQGPTAAAIANSVADAIGVRVRDLPLTPDAVLAALAGNGG
jgi:CO/xanthine dehydrogenase Mo-binding subunit